MNNRRDIENELVYFKKVVRNMDNKDFYKRIKIENHEIPFAELDFSAEISSDFNVYQNEIARIYSKSQQSISRKPTKIFNEIKFYLSKS